MRVDEEGTASEEWQIIGTECRLVIVYHREHVRVRDEEHGSVYHGQHDVQQDGGDNIQQVEWQIRQNWGVCIIWLCF